MTMICRPPTPILSPWGPAAAGTIARAFLYNPDVPSDGPMPRLISLTLISRRVTTLAYDATVAPRWNVAWLEAEHAIVRAAPEGGEFIPAAGLNLQPVECRPIYFEAAAVKAIVRLDNRGMGFPWPMQNSGRAMVLFVAADQIGTDCVVHVSPQIGVIE